MSTHPTPAPRAARRASLERALPPRTGPDLALCALCANALPPHPAVVVLADGPTVAARCVCDDCMREHVALALSIQARAAGTAGGPSTTTKGVPS